MIISYLENDCLVLAEVHLESDTVAENVLFVDVLNDAVTVLVEHLVFSGRQDHTLVVEEFDLALLAGFCTHRRIFATVDGVGFEGLGELLLEATGVEYRDRHGARGIVVGRNPRFARLVHSTEMDLAVLVAETAVECGVRRVGLGIEFGSSVAEMEAALRVALTSECKGNERKSGGNGESELHVWCGDWNVGWLDVVGLMGLNG